MRGNRGAQRAAIRPAAGAFDGEFHHLSHLGFGSGAAFGDARGHELLQFVRGKLLRQIGGKYLDLGALLGREFGPIPLFKPSIASCLFLTSLRTTASASASFSRASAPPCSIEASLSELFSIRITPSRSG